MATKRRRWLLISTAVAAVLILAAATTLPALLDVERYRDRIERGLNEATGWQSDLGAIRFSVLRGMVLDVRPARLAAPGDSSSFDIESFQIRAELFPLLRGQLKIRSVELVRPEIRLVRLDTERGWILPGAETSENPAANPGPAAAAGEPAPGSAPATGTAVPATGSSPIEITVDRVRVQGGRLVLDDRAGDPPLDFAVADLDLELAPQQGTLSGRGRLDADGGRFRVEGSPTETLTVSLEGLRTELLLPLLGTALIHGGGRLSGEVRIAQSTSIESRLRGDGIRLLSGERPFDEFDLELALHGEGGSWQLDRLRMVGDALQVEGSGRLTPALALRLVVPSTPLEVALRASRSILPLSLEVTGPGALEARLELAQPAGADLHYTAEGRFAAASFRASEMLPPVENVQAEFAVDRQGRLEVRLLEGTVAGGPVDGVARLASVDPPGRLTFEGGLEDAALGALLSGLIGDSAGRIRGATGLRAAVGVDLAAAEIDARAISGRLDLDSREVSLPGWDLEGAIVGAIDRKLGGIERLAALAGRTLKSDEGSAASEAVERLLNGLQAKIDFDSWPWKLERLALEAGDLSADGAGTFDAETGAVDLRFSARLTPQKSAELVEKTRELRALVDGQGRLTLPLRVEGPLLSPSIQVDLARALSGKLEGEKTEDRVKGLLKGLIDRRKK